MNFNLYPFKNKNSLFYLDAKLSRTNLIYTYALEKKQYTTAIQKLK